jgi:DNA replication and repair protein RecF
MLAELRLKQFRSYDDNSFEFDAGVNIIVGPNASGKTNLLEAILMVAKGSSYRAKDYELIKTNTDWARLEARLTSGSDRILKLTKAPTISKTLEVDGKVLRRILLNHRLPVVLFEPDHLRLLSGGPDRRRVYADDLLEQTLPGYGVLRRQYARTLAQRNSLLKSGTHSLATQLFPWNVRLSQLAGQIVVARTRLVDKIQSLLPGLYGNLSKSNVVVGIAYSTQCPVEAYETHLLQKLELVADTDRLRGYTSYGPHRDDLLLTFNDRDVQQVASRGEIRTVILALKIIELQLLELTRAQTPLLLLDDVFSELDGARRHSLTDYLANYQTFITTTDADLVLRHFTKDCNVMPVQRSVE